MKCSLVVFARPPATGRVKTRLAAGVGAVAAAEVYRALLAHTLKIAARSGVDVVVSIAETADRAWMKGVGAPVEIQCAGDLGQRMGASFRRRFELGSERVVVIGSDNPCLRTDHIDAAFRALDAAPVVLGPATDGGYWLVAVPHGGRLPAGLFEGVRWSGPHALTDTEATLGRLGPARLAAVLSDVDNAVDLPRRARWAAG